MSDTEEDSTSSDSWPVNEDWLIDIIKEHHRTASNIKITVSGENQQKMREKKK